MLTLSQRKTFKFVLQFISKHGYSPTAAEIAQGIGIKSRGVVHRYLKGLQANGYIRLTPRRHRNIELLKKSLSNSSPKLPLIGHIAAGRPIETMDEQETIDILDVFLGEHRYALRVKGDSMVEDGIYDGDIIVCERTQIAQEGQIVVALIDQEKATLKRIKQDTTATITLVSANASLLPMTYSSKRVQIQGVYVGLMRFQAT